MPHKIAAATAAAALTVLLSFPANVHAQGITVLTFDYPGTADAQPVNQTYGDNVTSANMDGFLYGGGNGFTPDITVQYSGGNAGPRFWTTGFADLTNVIYGEPTQLLLVTFTPQAGATVALNSFDLGGWPGSDYTIDAVQVFGDGGSTLFNQEDVLVRGDTGHTSFTFNNVTATSFLTIQIDARNLGTSSDNIGIDNISFTQINASSAAPEPATCALLATGLLPVFGSVVIRKRRPKSKA